MVTYPQTSFGPPPGSTRITLVRHGQTDPADRNNPFPLIDGHGDPKLTKLGEQQAVAVADRLQGESIDAMFVSSLTRTHQTAAPLVARNGLQPTVEPGLREVFMGDWEGGMFRFMLAEDHPSALKFRETYEWGSIPGAETNAELQARTAGAISAIAGEHPDQHVVCFVHGGVISALCAYAAKSEHRAFAGANNGSLHRLYVTEDRWFVRTFNDVNHLDGVMTPEAIRPA